MNRGKYDSLVFFEISKAFETVEEFVGKEWLEEGIKKLNLRKPPKKLTKYSFLRQKEPHPLIWLWKKAIESYQRCIKDQMLQVSEELLQISVLGRDLAQLKDVSIIDKNGNVLKGKTLKNRFKEKFTDEDNPERFEKAVYEIQIAAGYRRLGYEVFFVEESEKEGEKTYDLQVKIGDEVVYVECKKKDRLSERDRKINVIWNNLIVEILGHLKKKNYGILIKSQKDPVQNDEKEIMRKIKEMINSKNLLNVSKQGKYEIVVFEIVPSVVFTPTYGWAQIEHVDFFYSVYILPEIYRIIKEEIYLDYFTVSADNLDKPPNILWINPKFVGFSLSKPPDRIEGVIDRLEEANKQLPITGPGLIYIQIFPHPRMMEQDFKRLEERIKGKMKIMKEGRINAVILTATFLEKLQNGLGGLAYKHKSRVIPNPNPKSPLPTDFTILGLPDEETR